ncbi:MAG TPA: ABC transporter permease [Gaiellaceae bacterium]|nr:ABC transporter permease [Gaiellaceae bacterium]
MSTVVQPTPQSQRRRRLHLRAVAGVVLPLATLALLVVAWELATRIFDWPIWLVPGPGDVWSALVENRSLLPRHFRVTLVETLGGFALAICVGIPLAVAIASSRLLERTIYPVLLGLNAVPKIAIAPILVLWMGFGYGPKIVVTFLLCIFPIVISTATGLKSTPPELVELVRSLDASRFALFRRVRFPSALPHIFVGLKVAISLAVIGAVIGEFVGAEAGLGHVIIASGSNVDTSLAFGAMVLLGVLSVALFYALVGIERLLVPWARHEEH